MTGALSPLRIARTEIVFLGLAVVVLSVASLVLAVIAGQLAPACLDGGGSPVSCEGTELFFDVARVAGALVVGFAGLPLAVGAVLGVQLVAREIEQGTASFAWSVAPSRRRWFIEGTIALGLVVVVLLTPLAIIGQLLTGAVDPGADPTRSLDGFGFRGPSLVLRGVAMFSIGVILGASTGRLLPALLAAVVPAVLLIAFGTTLGTVTMSSEVIGELGQPLIANSIVMDERFAASDGTLMTVDEAFASAPAGVDPETWVEDRFQRVAIGISATRYPDVELRSSIALAIIAMSTWVTGLAVVERRRPY